MRIESLTSYVLKITLGLQRKIIKKIKNKLDSRLKLLLVDLTSGPKQSGPPNGFESEFDVHLCGEAAEIPAKLAALRPDAICLDFDYPDRAALRFATWLKQTYQSIPMILITIQHSEALAVWAFRNGFVDFLTKPLDAQTLIHCRVVLDRIRQRRRGQRRREMALRDKGVPAETKRFVSASSKISPAIYYVLKNYPKKISSKDTAKLCSMSPVKFSRQFKQLMGMPFCAYVIRCRLREAHRLLQNPQAKISEVAYAVGFNDTSYFGRQYKRLFGFSPSVNRTKGERDGKRDTRAAQPAATFR